MNSNDDWRGIRQQRSSPPGQAERDEERRRVFQSALAQAEELWDAAAATGPASRPLPLFYCLSQAARAVCAAWTTSEPWRPESHGLRRGLSDDPSPAGRVLNHATEVRSPETGVFSKVARATATDTFTGSASVADLWASLPGFPVPGEHFGDRPRCLFIEPVNLPNDGRSVFERVAAQTHVAFRLSAPPIEELRANYPELRGIVQDGTRPRIFGGNEPLFRFDHDDGTPRPLYEVGSLMPDAPDSFSDRVVRPKVGDAVIGPPSEFLTLYALLFCLSELARYYPDTWVRVLDADESTLAVTLEGGLDAMLERAPGAIRAALLGPLRSFREAALRALREEADAIEGRAAPDDDAEA